MHRSTPAVHHKTSKRCNGSSSGGRGTNGNTTNLIHSTQTVDSVNRHESKRQKMDWDLEPFDKLHPNENAQRIMSRYKMILKGKNTVGYSQYVQQVPKQQRHIRSMDTPQTPDHTLDIPAKRWQGLVKAWFVRTSLVTLLRLEQVQSRGLIDSVVVLSLFLSFMLVQASCLT